MYAAQLELRSDSKAGRPMWLVRLRVDDALTAPVLLLCVFMLCNIVREAVIVPIAAYVQF